MTFLRLIQYFIFLAIIGGIIVGINTYTGMATLEVNNHIVEMPFSYFVTGLFLGVFVLYLVVAVIRLVCGLPQRYRQYLSEKRNQKSIHLVIDSLTALAAQQESEALDRADQAMGLDSKNPLIFTVNAFTALHAHQDEKAKIFFQSMVDQTRLKFLGLYGLIQIAKRHHQVQEAQKLLMKAFSVRHDSPWVLKEILNNNLQCLDLGYPVNLKDQKYSKLLDKAQWGHHLAVHYAFQAQRELANNSRDNAKDFLKKSIAEEPTFHWSVLTLGQMYVAEGAYNKALKILKPATMGDAAHPEILKLQVQCMPEKSPTQLYYHFSQDQSPKTNRHWYYFLAELAINANLWAEAKRWAETGLKIKATQGGIVLLKKALKALNQTVDIAALYPHVHDDANWYCSSCKHTHSTWSLKCSSCGALDTINCHS
ncbi:MAG: heme biosynthesis HemY N-terminal domain-containing protein [Alphaproteobacteria bacterium]|nr:heme biosynthesis HemY N-terminal domain-containing protein [Alphaproteobacteria bacterium]